MAGRLAACVRSAEGVSEEDLALCGSPVGVLFRPGGEDEPEDDGAGDTKGRGRRGKGAGGDVFASSLEDEEWERQVREDLAKKKRASSSSGRVSATLTPREEELLGEQTVRRAELSALLDEELPRAQFISRGFQMKMTGERMNDAWTTWAFQSNLCL